ncbi:MAG: aminotransferase class V-fold PLP-dependent enzyme [Candidatus Caldarchaeum sp.]|nr:aminotransferase class V-fold PLP-dependent enzyme [Candidatus Caldarchaeum sp.]
MSVDVIQNLRKYEQTLIQRGNPWKEWTAEVYKACDIFAKIIGAKSDEICPHYSASSALISLVSSFKPNGRKKIVTTDLDYPSMGVVLTGLKAHGFEVEIIKHRDGVIYPDDYRRVVDSKTLLVAIFHVSALNGFKQQVEEIVETCRNKGAYLLLDVYQSVGVVPVDVRQMDVDFVVAGATKFLLGLPGSGFLYVKRELVDELRPTAVSWFSQKDPFLFGPEKMNYRDDAKRFEMGTWSVPSMYAAVAGLNIISKIGINRIYDQVEKLKKHFINEANKQGLRFFSPIDEPLGPTLSVWVGNNSHTVELMMRQRKIITSARGPGLRFAHHFFNNRADVEKGVEQLGKVLKRFKSRY